MTSGKQVLKDPAKVQGSVEKEEKQALDEIRWREHDTESEIVRKAIREYIKNHGAGNSTFKLDNWNNNPDFQIMPTLSARSENWYSFLSNCDKKELTDIMIFTMRINRQCKDIQGQK